MREECAREGERQRSGERSARTEIEIDRERERGAWELRERERSRGARGLRDKER